MNTSPPLPFLLPLGIAVVGNLSCLICCLLSTHFITIIHNRALWFNEFIVASSPLSSSLPSLPLCFYYCTRSGRKSACKLLRPLWLILKLSRRFFAANSANYVFNSIILVLSVIFSRSFCLVYLLIYCFMDWNICLTNCSRLFRFGATWSNTFCYMSSLVLSAAVLGLYFPLDEAPQLNPWRTTQCIVSAPWDWKRSLIHKCRPQISRNFLKYSNNKLKKTVTKTGKLRNATHWNLIKSRSHTLCNVSPPLSLLPSHYPLLFFFFPCSIYLSWKFMLHITSFHSRRVLSFSQA